MMGYSDEIKVLKEKCLDNELYCDSLSVSLETLESRLREVNDSLDGMVNGISSNNGGVLFQSGEHYKQLLLEDNATVLKKDGIHREKLKEALQKEQREWDEYKAMKEAKSLAGRQRKDCDVELRKLSSYIENGREGKYLPDALEEKLLSIAKKGSALEGKQGITLCLWIGVDLNAENKKAIEFRPVGKELTNGEKKWYCYDKVTEEGMFYLFKEAMFYLFN